MNIAPIFAAALAASTAGKFQPDWDSLERNYSVPEWYENAKFGIFCHWGPQCIPECGDWYARNMYNPGHRQARFHAEKYGDPKTFGFKDLIPLWKAEKWDPDELCALYKRMGARYIQAMANHHDNFDMFDSTYQPWNSVKMGPKKDILAGWKSAAEKNGLRFGVSIHAAHAWMFYEYGQKNGDTNMTGGDPEIQLLYRQNHPCGSIGKKNNWQWQGPKDSLPTEDFMENVRLRTMEIVTKYRPDLLYFDDTVVPFHKISDKGLRIVSDFYNMNSNAVCTGKILDRRQRKAMIWDVERGTPPEPMSPKWQTDTCIGSWHYSTDVYEKNRYKSAAYVLRMLADIVAKNGNLCLSVPIRADGSIDDKERAICEDIAAWMAVNGTAVFDTVPHTVCGEGPQLAKKVPMRDEGFNEGAIPKATEKDIRYLATKDGRTIYAIVLVPPAQDVTPAFAALGDLSAAKISRLKQVKDLPAVFRIER
ncbi:MAG: alpha-L-fucosidase [Kiritimatiellia bacterium]